MNEPAVTFLQVMTFLRVRLVAAIFRFMAGMAMGLYRCRTRFFRQGNVSARSKDAWEMAGPVKRRDI